MAGINAVSALLGATAEVVIAPNLVVLRKEIKAVAAPLSNEGDVVALVAAGPGGRRVRLGRHDCAGAGQALGR